MEYQCVSARFLFFNGKNQYTVEYSYGISTWFVFKDEENTDALYGLKVNPSKQKSPNRAEADNILELYLGGN